MGIKFILQPYQNSYDRLRYFWWGESTCFHFTLKGFCCLGQYTTEKFLCRWFRYVIVQSIVCPSFRWTHCEQIFRNYSLSLIEAWTKPWLVPTIFSVTHRLVLMWFLHRISSTTSVQISGKCCEDVPASSTLISKKKLLIDG